MVGDVEGKFRSSVLDICHNYPCLCQVCKRITSIMVATNQSRSLGVTIAPNLCVNKVKRNDYDFNITELNISN
jgi:hypothetical protein